MQDAIFWIPNGTKQWTMERIAALLDESRKFQNEVSERLAEQVLHALYELLRGFQAAHDASKGELLRQPLAEHPDEVYRALLTVILRLVFLLYAEERDMLPEDETFLRYYSLAGLYERLREDAALFSDTMDQRYGAWAQLLVLFRMIHDGAEAGAMRLPKRHGVLFDPARFTFLEGRLSGLARDERCCLHHVRNAEVEPARAFTPRCRDKTKYAAIKENASRHAGLAQKALHPAVSRSLELAVPARHLVKIPPRTENSHDKLPGRCAILWFELSDSEVCPECLAIFRQWHLKLCRNWTLGRPRVPLWREAPFEDGLSEAVEIRHARDRTFFRVERAFFDASAQEPLAFSIAPV